MTLQNNNSEKLVEYILEKLQAMSNIKVNKIDGAEIFELLKEKHVFGYVEQDQLFLLNAEGKRDRVNDKTLKNNDDLLRAATQAYWNAADKIKPVTPPRSAALEKAEANK